VIAAAPANAWFRQAEGQRGEHSRGDRVTGGNVARDVFDSHEAISDTAADVLRHLRSKITIKSVFTATT
jgi:hypothetical protein